MTDLVDIFEAAGGVASEDRTQVSMPLAPTPFEILLRVVPTGVSYGNYGDFGEKPKVTFAVLLLDEMVVESGAFGGVFHDIRHTEELELPVDQVVFATETSSISTEEELRAQSPGTVIVGPAFNNEVYQFNGELWSSPGTDLAWSSKSLVARGPYKVIHKLRS